MSGFTPIQYAITQSGNLDEYAQMVMNLNGALTRAFQNVLVYQGTISAAADFPTLAAVNTGYVYKILVNVTDNNAAKTNTGISFLAGDEIFWSGSTWLDSSVPFPAGLVYGPATAVGSNLAGFDSTSGKLILDSGIAAANVVQGPASAVGSNLAGFNSTTGKLILDSGIAAANVVQGPASAVGDDIATYNSTTGKLIKDSGVAVSSVVVGPASAVGDNLTSYNSTTGKLIKDSGIAAANVVQGPASAVGDNLTSYNSTTGKLIKDSGVAAASVVVGPASAVGDNLTSYNSTTGKLIKDSGIAAVSVVVGPASAVGDNLVGFNSTTGKLVKDSGITASSVTTGAIGGSKGGAITVGTKVSTTINASVQLKDAAGVNLAVRGSVFAYLSDNADGSTITTTVPDGGVVIGTNGLAIPVIAAKAFHLVSGATGIVDLDITHSGSHTYYLVVVLAQGTLLVSGAIAF